MVINIIDYQPMEISVNSSDTNLCFGDNTDISAEVASKNVPKPIVPTYIYEAMALKKEAEKRKRLTPEEEMKKIADNIIETADETIKQLMEEDPTDETKVYSDIERIEGDS